MKRFFIIATLFAFTFTSYSQSLGFQDLGLLFSQDDGNGSARFTSMSGAFGALGGDVSSININPAGIAIFKNSAFSGTLNSRNTDIAANYFGNTSISLEQYFNISQAGAVLVFKSAYDSDWSKFAVGFNYRMTKDFSDSFFAKGNSNVASFREFPLFDPNDPVIDYNKAIEQRFFNDFDGELSELNIAFSSVHKNKFYVGLGLNFYDLNFSQKTSVTEFNDDVDGNELDANFYQENNTVGTGFSANLGFIYKVNSDFRFGLSYQTPTWFSEIIQTSNILDNDGFFGDTEITVSNANDTYTNNLDNFGQDYFPSETFLYRLKTPSKLTASAAYIFGKSGLLSIDYSSKNYKNLRFPDRFFDPENQFFQNELRNTYNVNIGGEWRIDQFSIRGGYKFEQSPYTSNTTNTSSVVNLGNVEGYSFGGGYNFGNFKFDLSYSNNNSTGSYNFYPRFAQFDNVSPTNLTFDNRVVTGTFTINL